MSSRGWDLLAQLSPEDLQMSEKQVMSFHRSTFVYLSRCTYQNLKTEIYNFSRCSDVRTSGRPVVRTPGRPNVWSLDVRTSGCPDVRIVDVRTSSRPDVRTSRRRDVRPDVRTSGGRPDNRTSGRLILGTPEHKYTNVGW